MQQFVKHADCPRETVVPGHVERQVKSYDRGLMVVEVAFSDGAQGDEHAHVHEQISYCLEGSFDYHIGQTHYRMEPGDTIYVPANQPHGCRLLTPHGRLLDIFTPFRENFVKKGQD